MKESKTYKVRYFHPEDPSSLERFLDNQLVNGLELIAATGNCFIFKRRPSTLVSSQRATLKHPFIPEDIPLIEVNTEVE